MIKKDKSKELHYTLTGELKAADIWAAAEKILAEYGKKAKVAGFRPGHIPMNILKQKFGADAYADAADKMLNGDIGGFIKSKGLKTAGNPRVDGDFAVGKDYEYTAEFDVMPQVPEIDLGKIEIKEKIEKITDKDVKDAIEKMRKMRAQYEKQDDKYKTADGDSLIMDFKGFIGKKAFEGGEASRHRLVIGSNSFIPGFEEQLIGHKVGEDFDIKVTFPKEYHSEELAGKEARFEIKIHEIRKPQLPTLDEEFAKSVGQESVEKMTAHVREILESQAADAARETSRAALLDVLADKVKILIPESLVEKELAVSKSEADARKEKWDEKKERKDAERRVKLGIILAEWGNANKVKVEQADIQEAIWKEASRYPQPMQVFEFYEKNRNALALLNGMVFERKTLDAMLAKTKK